MRIRFDQLCRILCALCLDLILSGTGYSSLPVREVPASGTLHIEIADRLGSSLYHWPQTLVCYPLKFSPGDIQAEKLILVDAATGNQIPVQWSEIKQTSSGSWISATLNFITDLPSGAHRAFELSRGEPAGAFPEMVTVKAGNEGIELLSNRIGVRLPITRSVAQADRPPGPISALGRDGRWLGKSVIVSPSLQVERIESVPLEKGPLFASCRVSYYFANGGRYDATVRVVAGYDHFDFQESVAGLSPEDRVAVEMIWTDFRPTRRAAANDWKMPGGSLGIDEAVVTDGIAEDPHWFPPEHIEQPSKEMIYTLASFQGNQPRNAVPVMSFWEAEAGGLELSAFVGDTLDWREAGYSVWQPSGRLDVKFRYDDSQLVWSWPLSDGERKTGIAIYPVSQGEASTAAVWAEFRSESAGRSNAFAGQVVYDQATPFRYAQSLRSWYGALNLDRVKEWTLVYPADARILRPVGRDTHPNDTPKALADALFHSALAMYPLGLNLGVMNISHRPVASFIDRYSRLRDKFSLEERQRVDALLLLSAYLSAGEDMSPVRTTLAGTPNMAADGYCIPAEISALFPGHPMGRIWRDQFEKTVELQGFFYTRPDVDAWEAKGGRWAESLATYQWAQLLPLTTAQLLAATVDGRNRLASPAMALRAEWLIGQLTAPIYNPNPLWRSGHGTKPPHLDPRWKPGAPLISELGFERQFPAHGAHNSGTTTVLPGLTAVLASALMNYAPLAAEHLLWAHSQVTSKDAGEWVGNELQASVLGKLGDNKGTRPALASAKYTGHGLVLRAGVGTPDEISVHLDQVDQGPNYRWGNSGEGSAGILYFYGGGRVWTGHETENTGDHTTEDTLGMTTFGVWKDGTYRSIGANALERPLHDVGVAQLGELSARADHSPYSWPQYHSRSVMLVGSDYFLLFDVASGPARFSWFNAVDLNLPELIFLEPDSSRADHWAEMRTRMASGVMRDLPRENQSSLVLVTHKRGEVKVSGRKATRLLFPQERSIVQWSKPKAVETGVYRVETANSKDIIFRAAEIVVHSGPTETFEGTAGVIRRSSGHRTEFALLAGRTLFADGVGVSANPADDLAIGAAFDSPCRITGRYHAPHGSAEVRLKIAEENRGSVYVDGNSVPARRDGNELVVKLPQGAHVWEYSPDLPVPISPEIIRTENFSGGANLIFQRVPAAETYIAELSEDGGTTWRDVARASQGPLRIVGLTNGRKFHLRVRAENALRTGAAGALYPLYTSDAVAHAPDGLRVILSSNCATLSWGEVLGVSSYRLYRRRVGEGEKDWITLYSGPLRGFVDSNAAGVVPPEALPGSNVPSASAARIGYEYVVSAVNGNGESAYSVVADTDPSSWRNWWPAGVPRQFQRRTGYGQPPYVAPDATAEAFYPDAVR